MGHSNLAFGDEERAAAFASDVGREVIRWNVVLGMPDRGGSSATTTWIWTVAQQIMITMYKGDQEVKMKKLIILIAALALTLAACGGSDVESTPSSSGGSSGPGDAVAGADVFKGTCTACHGADLAGIDGLGKPLAPSDFVSSQSETDLAAFIAAGRSTSHPDNTTGVDMPPRGGNPSLKDQDLLNVAAYLQAQN